MYRVRRFWQVPIERLDCENEFWASRRSISNKIVILGIKGEREFTSVVRYPCLRRHRVGAVPTHVGEVASVGLAIDEGVLISKTKYLLFVRLIQRGVADVGDNSLGKRDRHSLACRVVVVRRKNYNVDRRLHLVIVFPK